MAKLKKDEQIIELTEIVEKAPDHPSGGWMDVTPPPPVEKTVPEPPKIPKREPSRGAEGLKDIPESPLKKFLLAEEEGEAPPEAPVRPPVVPPPMAPPPPRAAPQPPRPFSEPSRPAPPTIESEMRGLREAMLARVEKWTTQEGLQVLERIAREMFPKIAEKIIREEIEKIKAQSEEK